MRAAVLWSLIMIVSQVTLMPLNRTIYGYKVEIGGQMQTFQRPFFLEFVMFLAMAACLLLEVPAWREKRAQQQDAPFWPRPAVCLKILVPALCDLIGSWFVFGGALWVNASVVEMSGCTNTIFTALLSVCFLKKKIARHEWIGIALSVFGVLTVGFSQVISAGDSDDQQPGEQSLALTLLGLLLIFGANFWYAVEFIVTEKLLGEEQHLSAFMSVGIMGLWGILMFIPLFALLRATPETPVKYAPLWHEDVTDSVSAMLRNTPLFIAIVAIFVALIFFNAAAFRTCELLNALTRVVLSSMVSPIVWTLDLCLAFVSSGAGAAERLTYWSFLQLFGFVLIFIGSFVFNAVGPCSRCAKTGSDASAPLMDS